MSNYTEILEFFVENGITLNSNQIEALKEEFLGEGRGFRDAGFYGFTKEKKLYDPKNIKKLRSGNSTESLKKLDSYMDELLRSGSKEKEESRSQINESYLNEESAFTRHMINKTNEWIDNYDAYKELNGRSGKNIDKLKSELGDKMDSIDRDNQYTNVHPTNYPSAVHGNYFDELKDAKKDFNNKVNSAHPENTKGKNDHKTAGDYLAMQKAKNMKK